MKGTISAILLLLVFVCYVHSQTTSARPSPSRKPPGPQVLENRRGAINVCTLSVDAQMNTFIRYTNVSGGTYRGSLSFTSCAGPITLISQVWGPGGAGNNESRTGGGGGSFIQANITFQNTETVNFVVALGNGQPSTSNLTRTTAGLKHVFLAGNGQDGQATYGGFGGNATYMEIPTNTNEPVTVTLNGGIGGGYADGQNAFGVASGGSAPAPINSTASLSNTGFLFIVAGGGGGVRRGGGSYQSIGGAAVTEGDEVYGGGGAGYGSSSAGGSPRADGAPGLQAGSIFGPSAGGGGAAAGSNGQVYWQFAK